MPTLDDVRRIAATLPGMVEGEGTQFGFSVENKGKAQGVLWGWLERIHPKKARVVNNDVLAIVVPNLDVKEFLVASGGDAIFTEPHYNGYKAVLVRLEHVSLDQLEDLIVEAWRCKAPKEALAAWDTGRGGLNGEEG